MLFDELGVAAAAVPPLAEGKRLAVGDQGQRAATSTDPFVGTPSRAGPEVVVGIYAPVRTSEGSHAGSWRWTSFSSASRTSSARRTSHPAARPPS